MRSTCARITLIALTLAFTACNDGGNDAGGAAGVAGALAPVCSGQGVAGAGAYKRSNPGPSKIVLLRNDGAVHSFTDLVSPAWTPATLAEAELVACMTEGSKSTYATCQYTGGSTITRIQWTASLDVREARSGRVLGSTTVTGSIPDTCPATTTGSAEIIGKPVQYPDVENFLRRFVE